MARARRLSSHTAVRNAIRGMIRSDMAPSDIAARVGDMFPRTRAATISRILATERSRQNTVDTITHADKRRTIDLGQLVNCPPGRDHVRMGISISFPDPATGIQRTWWDSHVVPARGRAADIINSALQATVDDLAERGYPAPNIRSSMTSGRTRYRIDYVECM